MYRLSGFDASMLPLEGPMQPMTGCALWELDTSAMPAGYSFERFRDQLSARMPALPESAYFAPYSERFRKPKMLRR